MVGLQKSLPLNKPARETLQLKGNSLTPDELNELLGHDSSPPGLDANGAVTHILISLHGHLPTHILLDDGN